MKKILIVEPEPMTADGLGTMLRELLDVTVVGQAHDSHEGWRLFEERQPDLCVVEIALANVNGLDLIKKMLRQAPSTLAVATARQAEAYCAVRAMRAGARAYLTRQESGEVFVRVIKHVLDGHYYVSERVMDDLLKAVAESTNSLIPSPDDVLSRRERELFLLAGQGYCTREIAERMGVSVKTVESYRNRIKEKLNLDDTSDLIQVATRWVTSDRLCYSMPWCEELTEATEEATA